MQENRCPNAGTLGTHWGDAVRLAERLDQVDASMIMMLFSHGDSVLFSCKGEIGFSQPSLT